MDKRYIELGQAKRALSDEAWYNPYFHQEEYAINVLNKLPAADVAPVRHGRWIAEKEDIEWGVHLIRYRCSECKERPHFDKDKYKFVLSPYCPNCGAKMDEEDGK